MTAIQGFPEILPGLPLVQREAHDTPVKGFLRGTEWQEPAERGRPAPGMAPWKAGKAARANNIGTRSTRVPSKLYAAH
ncbi:hypothetical protein HMPREF9946_00898 [Acetobacteraceae bacterium AT-5844]|nr:hypothetical protein HMPREF9946_00898 [Acetobacteraceae bacterium AT-5844]